MGQVGAVKRTEQDRSISQTMSKGLRVIELLSESRLPMTSQQLADELQVDRAVIYRLLRTLGSHGLLSKTTADGKYSLGLRLLTMARGMQEEVRRAALPVLVELANATDGTAFLGIREGDEVVCLVSAEAPQAFVSIRYREGVRHEIFSGASGHAILSLDPPSELDDEEVVAARLRGYATSEQSLEYNTSAISAPLRTPVNGERGCVTVLFARPHLTDPEHNGKIVMAAARHLEDLLS